MAQVEFTQQFQIAYTSGVATYVQLQSTPGIYVVKGLTCYSSVGITPSGSESLVIINASSSGGGGDEYIYSTDATVDANVILPVFSPLQQVILTENYLGFRAISASSGNLIMQISYSFFPTSNTLAANFGNSYQSVTASTVGAPFTGLSATVPTIIKSISITNAFNTSTLAVTPLLTTASTTDLAFDNTTTIAAGGSYVYTLPLYLTSADTISIQNAGSATCYVLYSYTQDPA